MSEISEKGIETLLVIALHADPVVTAPELAEELGVSPQAVNKRLETLSSDGYVNSKKVGAAAKVYWLTKDGQQAVSEESLDWI